MREVDWKDKHFTGPWGPLAVTITSSYQNSSGSSECPPGHRSPSSADTIAYASCNASSHSRRPPGHRSPFAAKALACSARSCSHHLRCLRSHLPTPSRRAFGAAQVLPGIRSSTHFLVSSCTLHSQVPQSLANLPALCAPPPASLSPNQSKLIVLIFLLILIYCFFLGLF